MVKGYNSDYILTTYNLSAVVPSLSTPDKGQTRAKPPHVATTLQDVSNVLPRAVRKIDPCSNNFNNKPGSWQEVPICSLYPLSIEHLQPTWMPPQQHHHHHHLHCKHHHPASHAYITSITNIASITTTSLMFEASKVGGDGPHDIQRRAFRAVCRDKLAVSEMSAPAHPGKVAFQFREIPPDEFMLTTWKWPVSEAARNGKGILSADESKKSSSKFKKVVPQIIQSGKDRG